MFFIVHDGTLTDLLASNPTNAPDLQPNAYFSLSRLNPDPGSLYGGDHAYRDECRRALVEAGMGEATLAALGF